MLTLTTILLQTIAAPIPRPIGPPDAVLTHEFIRVFALSERPDGRVVLVDRGDELLAVADFGRKTVTPLGRSGGGPEEYRFPGRLAPMAGDSLMVADDGNNRLVVLGPDLKIHRVANGRAPGLQFELSPSAVDQAGRFYSVIPAWMMQRTESDSLPVVRFIPGAGSVETVAHLRASPRPPPPPRRDRPTFAVLAFAPGDSWAVTPAGRVALVRAADYRVEWIEPNGRRVVGPRVDWKPIRVVAKDRSDFVRRNLITGGISGKGGADRPPGGLSPVTSDMVTDRAVAEMVENMTFADTKPPFTEAAPIIAPDGTLWVERSVASGAPSTWDQFDAEGRLSGSRHLPAGRRLVGVGRSHVYAVATDEDGIERLERYPLKT